MFISYYLIVPFDFFIRFVIPELSDKSLGLFHHSISISIHFPILYKSLLVFVFD